MSAQTLIMIHVKLACKETSAAIDIEQKIYRSILLNKKNEDIKWNLCVGIFTWPFNTLL